MYEGQEPLSSEEANERVRAWAQRDCERELGWWIIHTKGQRFVGAMGFAWRSSVTTPGLKYVEVCGIASPVFWGQKVMLEGIVYLLGVHMDDARRSLSKDTEIRIKTHPDNRSSIRLAEKLGMRRAGEMLNSFGQKRLRWVGTLGLYEALRCKTPTGTSIGGPDSEAQT